MRLRLRESRIDALISVSTQLRRLGEVRVTADYQVRDPYPEQPEVVAQYLRRAEHIVATIDAIEADPMMRARIAARLANSG